MTYRTTTQVRIKKTTLERLRSLSYEQREDMVDLLNLAVVLLEREMLKSEDRRVVFPVEATQIQLPLGAQVDRVSFPVAPVIRRGFQVRGEVRHGE